MGENKKIQKGILILTPFFSPNIGGVETHLDDLVDVLDEQGYNIFVQTYSPVTTQNVSWKSHEKKGVNIDIVRYRWFGKNLFHKLEKLPLFDFLYLSPYLFCRTFFWMLFNKSKINVIHAHGFNAAWIGKIYKKIFKKKLIVSTHAIYEIDRKSQTARRIVSILKDADKILALSKGSLKELSSFGLERDKIDLFKHWIDLDKFKPLNQKKELRKRLDIKDCFTVLYVGRIIEKKGVKNLAEIAKELPDINFLFVGNGPESNFLKEKQEQLDNVKFIGQVNSNKTFEYYNASDCFCLPSQYEEGFGRVLMEAVACELPVVASDKGGIPEALDENVSILISPTKNNIKRAIERLYNNMELYQEMKSKCRDYAEKSFSKKNIKLITKYY